MLVNEVLDTITRYNLIENGDRIVCGVSGGPDSICMLDILNKIKDNLNFEIFVAHINHCIRDDAVEDEKFVENFSQEKGIKCFTKRIDVEKYANNNKVGTEEAGRILRYEFFDEVLKKTNSNKIAIAHNKNDNAETVLLNLIRGTGIAGLRGIEAKRDGKYIRPLIKTKRVDIERYCEEHNLSPRIDSTNKENIYRRNRIRNDLIVYIQDEFNPNIIDGIDRLSEIAVEEDEYLNGIAREKYDEVFLQKEDNQIVLDLKKFNLLDTVIKKRVIIYTIKELFGTSKGIEKVHIEDIIKLCERNLGNKFLVPQKNVKILVKNKKIFFIVKV